MLDKIKGWAERTPHAFVPAAIALAVMTGYFVGSYIGEAWHDLQHEVYPHVGDCRFINNATFLWTTTPLDDEGASVVMGRLNVYGWSNVSWGPYDEGHIDIFGIKRPAHAVTATCP